MTKVEDSSSGVTQASVMKVSVNTPINTDMVEAENTVRKNICELLHAALDGIVQTAPEKLALVDTISIEQPFVLVPGTSVIRLTLK